MFLDSLLFRSFRYDSARLDLRARTKRRHFNHGGFLRRFSAIHNYILGNAEYKQSWHLGLSCFRGARVSYRLKPTVLYFETLQLVLYFNVQDQPIPPDPTIPSTMQLNTTSTYQQTSKPNCAHNILCLAFKRTNQYPA